MVCSFTFFLKLPRNFTLAIIFIQCHKLESVIGAATLEVYLFDHVHHQVYDRLAIAMMVHVARAGPKQKL